MCRTEFGAWNGCGDPSFISRWLRITERDVRKWWRIGLSAKQIEALEAEARALCKVNGPAARKAVLDRAQALAIRHGPESMRLGRLAACMADQIKENTHDGTTLKHAGNDPERP